MTVTRERNPRTVLAGAEILLVEDEVIIAMDLIAALEEVGAKVHYARRQDGGLALARDTALAGAILDVNLGGDATCAPIADVLKSRSIPFLLYSGDFNTSGELIDRIGAPVAQKPISSDRLIGMLETLLSE